jgi:hypothetical protein
MPSIRELDHAECERLLRRGTFGRVALTTSRGPEIVPVNYAVQHDAVVIRTSSVGLLARHAHGKPVVFEVDLVDHATWQGWSVVARGIGEVVADPQEPAPGQPRVRPWADGERASELRLAWTELTGRKVGTAWDAEAAMYSRRATR